MRIGERLGGAGIDVHHVLELHVRLSNEIAGVDLADPASANNATSVIIVSAVFSLFDVQFEPVRQRDEQRLAEAHRAGGASETRRRFPPSPSAAHRAGRERCEAAVRNHHRPDVASLRIAHAGLRLAVRREADRDHDVVAARRRDLLAVHAAHIRHEVHALARMTERVRDVRGDRERATHADDIDVLRPLQRDGGVDRRVVEVARKLVQAAAAAGDELARHLAPGERALLRGDEGTDALLIGGERARLRLVGGAKHRLHLGES